MSTAKTGQPVGSALEKDGQRITAYCINRDLAMPIVPASQAREWIKQTNDGFASRCLPLLIANQSGWFLLNAQPLRLTWNGRRAAKNLHVEALEGEAPELANSHFGHGIVTWDVPYLFRTSPGYNLLVRGPANWPKDGISPLEGVVETDWLGATFSVNWQMTRIDHEVIFERGEPIAMIVPQRRQEIESFHPAIVDIESDPGILHDYERWESQRVAFIKKLAKGDPETTRQGWEKHYFRGLKVNGEPVRAHQTKLKLRAFKDCRTPSD